MLIISEIYTIMTSTGKRSSRSGSGRGTPRHAKPQELVTNVAAALANDYDENVMTLSDIGPLPYKAGKRRVETKSINYFSDEECY